MPTLRRSTRTRKSSIKASQPEIDLDSDFEPEEKVTVAATPKRRGRRRKNPPVAESIQVEPEIEEPELDEGSGDEAEQEEEEENGNETLDPGNESYQTDDEGEELDAGGGEDDDDDDDELVLSHDEDGSVVESDASGNVKASRRAKKPTKTSTVDSNAIEPYPFSKKTTRAYEGPFKRQRKTPHILQYMYGPAEAHTKLAYGMLNRFYHLETLPGRPVDDSSGPLLTPWVPEGFEASQQAALTAWLDRYGRDESVGPRQKLVKLSKAGMAPYLVKPEGNLAVLLGPYGEQQEITFPGGANRGVCLNSADLPTDSHARDERSQPKGWMLDAGGLVLSLAWAYRPENTDPVLALCVVPHSDQHHPNTAERDAHLGSRKHGIIQFWKFPAKKTKQEDMVPKAEPPILLRTLMFDWGRARRIKWCPVPPADGSIMGLLGLLTGDGKVRVLEIENVRPKERSTFCRWPFFSMCIFLFLRF